MIADGVHWWVFGNLSKSFTFVFDSDHNLIRLVDKIGGGRKDSSGSERQKNRFIVYNLRCK